MVDLLENDVNEATNLLVTHLQNICEKCGLLCHNKQGGSLYVCKQPEWFDNECLILKHKKCKLLNNFRAISDVNILNEYIETKHNFQKLCDKKHKQYKVDKKIEICNVAKNGDTSEFWKLVKSVTCKSNVNEPDISSNEWRNYLSNLLNPNLLDKSSEFSDFVDMFVQSHNNDCDSCTEDNSSLLNGDITSEEVLKEINKLKNNKAPGEDGLPGELYKSLSSQLLPVIVKLFNTIFHTGIFPECWSTAIIITLFKKSDRNECGNYRGISLLCVISKIFMGIICDRLTKWSDMNEHIIEEQAGFRGGYSTIDNIFILNSIIMKYLSKKVVYFIAHL